MITLKIPIHHLIIIFDCDIFSLWNHSARVGVTFSTWLSGLIFKVILSLSVPLGDFLHVVLDFPLVLSVVLIEGCQCFVFGMALLL